MEEGYGDDPAGSVDCGQENGSSKRSAALGVWKWASGRKVADGLWRWMGRFRSVCRRVGDMAPWRWRSSCDMYGTAAVGDGPQRMGMKGRWRGPDGAEVV